MFKYGHRRRCYVTLQRTGCAAQCEVFTAPRLALCDTWNWNDDNDTVAGIAILDTTAIPEMRIAQCNFNVVQNSPVSAVAFPLSVGCPSESVSKSKKNPKWDLNSYLFFASVLVGLVVAMVTVAHSLAVVDVNNKLIRRWDSERELPLRRHRTRTTKYNRDSCINSATNRRGNVLESMFTKFSEITQYNGHYAVQGHSRSPILVPMESSYTTSY